MVPGETELQVMPCGPSTRHRECISERIPDFVGQYATSMTPPTCALMELIETIRPPSAAVEHQARGLLGAEERAAQVHRVHVVPDLLGDVEERLEGGDARVVDQDVEPPQVAPDSGEHAVDLADLADIGADRGGPAAGGSMAASVSAGPSSSRG